MDALLTQPLLTSLLFGAVTAGVPLLLAGLGEQISEKAGVLNIGIEGMMLCGAYTGFAAAYYSGAFSLGFIAGGLGGMAVAAIVMLLCIRYGLNQIVIGIGLTIGVEGLTALLYLFEFSRTYPRLDRAPVLLLPGLSRIPILGPGLFVRTRRLLARILVAVLSVLFRSTHIGLNLEAAGNKPAALDAAGVDVIRTRSLAVLTTGFLAGVGGAYLANGAGLFVPFMTSGSGRSASCLRAGAWPADMGAAGGRPVRRQSVHDHGAAGGGNQHPDGRRADAAVRGGHAGSGNLRAAQRAAARLGPALCPRRSFSTRRRERT